jgi:ABC-2 type transport system permease protein
MTTAGADPVPSRLPTSVQQTLIVTKYELLNYFRTRRFYIILGIGLAISAILTALVAYYRPATLLDNALTFYQSWWGMSVDFIVVLAGIFFGGDAISAEFQNKTGYFVVGHPIRRAAIYAGKWIAAFIASVIVLLVYTALAVGNGLFYFGATVPWPLGEAVGLGLLYLVAVLAFTFLFSAMFKTSAMSILVTAILLLFGFSIIQSLVVALASTEPWFLLTYGGSIISAVLQSSYPAHVVTVRTFGVAVVTYTPYIWEGIVILLGYFVACAGLGLWLFERKEFN